ncbi:MmcQ/YjbR family DNA-binding protein [Pararhizobium antarcticum]|uniref:MmcQ/YjbR family DNA-binding protein n=1 Tax=Pararhizobium antarcticum TaxID=1798805 RepID=A0A657LR75_9HYPH|nr:MmcQ/YjbR family DNA-binding protein [Pararhizobium antarcticum]OJF95888.1 hypothetical protein AX760_18845 [Pararhizobium antarcticum]OJF99330.1 hypothetical protein AX761_11480 [Rhizobium sp. 58]
MLTEEIEKLALSLPGTLESAHFGKRDFRVGKRIFMTLPEAGRAVFKFTPEQQRRLLETEPGICAAVSGGWGVKGWTSVWFTQASEDLIHSVMETAWRNVAPKSLHNGAPPKQS